MKKKNDGWVYVISDGDAFKIGVSKNPQKRLKTLQTGNKKKLTLEFCEHKNEPYKIETIVHRTLNEYRTEGEWFEGCSFNDIRIALMLVTEYD